MLFFALDTGVKVLRSGSSGWVVLGFGSSGWVVCGWVLDVWLAGWVSLVLVDSVLVYRFDGGLVLVWGVELWSSTTIVSSCWLFIDFILLHCPVE